MEHKKIIVLSCMHGRHKTVQYCLEQMPFIDKVMIYTTDEDGRFLDTQNIQMTGQYKNNPLSFKWNAGIMSLESIEFDAVILLGSDDYIDEKFVQFVSDHIDKYEMIAFKDLYFKENDDLYYWGGYTNQRRGEPSGAGKVYTKKFLKRIRYNLFNEPRERGLDGLSWRRCKAINVKVLITTLKQNDLFLCDVKDGEGMTGLNRIQNLIKL